MTKCSLGIRIIKRSVSFEKIPEDNNYYGGVAGRVFALDQSLEWDYYIAQYDAEIRFLDDQLKRLFAEFDRKDLWDNSIIVFTADHGENLGENQYFFEHGWFPYTASSHVPLIIWDPREKPSRISTSIALLDLIPSLFKSLEFQRTKSLKELHGILLIHVLCIWNQEKAV